MAALPECRQFTRTGVCSYGASCRFKHEKNVKSKAYFNTIPQGEPTPAQLETCRSFARGACVYGASCRFQHDTAGISQSSKNPVAATQCRQFAQTGSCSYGASCRYQHVASQAVARVDTRDAPSLRQEQCHQFLTTGTCSYGASCRYVHSERSKSEKRCRQYSASGRCTRPNCLYQHVDPPPCSVCGCNPGHRGELCPAVPCPHCHKTGTGHHPQACPELPCHYCSKPGHPSDNCPVPRCCECGSIEHAQPQPECFHTGWYTPLRRMGGWTPAMDGMAADWHCCGCDDRSSRSCAAHKSRTCKCYPCPK